MTTQSDAPWTKVWTSNVSSSNHKFIGTEAEVMLNLQLKFTSKNKH